MIAKKVLKQDCKGKEDESIFSCHTETPQRLRLDKHCHATYSNLHHAASHFTLQVLFHTNNLSMTEKTLHKVSSVDLALISGIAYFYS